MSAAGVRERERDRDWDARSSYSTRDRDDRGGTTVRRYRYGGDDNTSSRDDNRDDERIQVDVRTSHRDRSREPDRDEVRRYEREVARGDYDRGYDRDYWRRDRDRGDDDGWREISISRDIARDPPRREDYELDRYTRSTEYYARPESRHDDRRSPQTIVIRNEAPQPIIIRDNPPARDREVIIRETRERSPSPKREEVHEETKEEKLELLERKSEVSAAPSRKEQQEDDYYYQRTTRDIVHRNREDTDDREYRRDVGPRDAVSNHDRGRERDYEDEVHYRRVVEEDGAARDSSPHHKRHLAEGALVGAAGAALLNNRGGKREGRSRSRAASIGKYIGGAALGTVGAELITRARSRHREERERSLSVERDLERDRSRGRYDDRDRDRDRDRSNSPIHAGNWAKLGAVAAIGALAGYAVTRGRGKGDDRRSRSRHRRSSYSRSRSHSRGRSTSQDNSARNPKHRNSVIAGAGLASAAAAGLWEHRRNKSKGREGRSKSRIRTGLPIAATGLAGAALAGLYENRKAKKEKARAESRRRSVSPSPTRSRSRSRSMGAYNDPRGPDENLISYGGGSIGPEHAHDRGDPAYDHHVRSRSLDSNGSSPTRRLSRSRDRSYAEGAAGAGVAGVAAHEAAQRRRRKQQERERRRMDDEQTDTSPNNGDYTFGPYGQAPPAAPQAPGQGQYPSHYYPPQENNNYGPMQYTGQPQYGSHDYNYQAPQAPAAPPNPYGYQPPHQPNPYGDPHDPYGRPNNHVSATPSSPQQQRYVPEHARSDLNDELSPRSHSPGAETTSRVSQDSGRRNSKSVAFNLAPRNEQEREPAVHRRREDASPVDERNEDSVAEGPINLTDGSDVPQRIRHRRRRRRRHSIDGSDADPHRQPREVDRDRGGRRTGRGRSHSPKSDDSGETIELPDRFDSDGQRKPQRGDEPLAGRIEDMLSGSLGRMFGRFGRR